MSNDLAEQLRRMTGKYVASASRIRGLEAERDRLRKALKAIRQTDVGTDTTGSVVRAYGDVIRLAEAALATQQGDLPDDQ